MENPRNTLMRTISTSDPVKRRAMCVPIVTTPVTAITVSCLF